MALRLTEREARQLPGLQRAAVARSDAARKGSYYKLRTKSYFEAKGYAVAFMERMMLIRKGRTPCASCGRPDSMPIKKDQFGADLLMLKADPPQVVFVQVKLGEKSIWPARREFLQYPFPPQALRWVVVWERGAHDPKVIDCTGDTPATMPVRAPKALRETLF